jgi:hypothetical protein
MNGFTVIAACIGCLLALYLWTATKQRWVPTLIAVTAVAACLWIAKFSVFLAVALGYWLFVLGRHLLRRWDSKHPTVQNIPDQEEPESCSLNTTTEEMSQKSAWEGWEVFRTLKQMTHERCRGGPPVRRERYEYDVRSTTVFVRLLESSCEGFDDTTYDVFNRSINYPQIEAEYRRDKERWKDNPSFITPIEETVARLQKQIGWHEIHGAIRYFVLTLCDKSSSDFDGRYARQRFYKDEQERLIKSFTQMEQRAKELNAVADRYGYSAPKDATPEVKEAIKQHLSVFKFGFHTRGEFLERGISLGILQEAGATPRSESLRRFEDSMGVTAPAPTEPPAKEKTFQRLGDLLVKKKVITSEQLEQATKFQKDTDTRLASALVKLGFLSDEDVTNFLSRQYGVPAINLSHLEIDPAVVKLIPYETAKVYQILPLSRVGDLLTIAMVDPTNVFAMDDIKFMTGFNIERVVASESSIIEGIDKAYGTSKDATRKVERVDFADGRKAFDVTTLPDGTVKGRGAEFPNGGEDV